MQGNDWFKAYKEVSIQSLPSYYQAQTSVVTHDKKYRLYRSSSGNLLNKQTATTTNAEKGKSDIQSCHIMLFEMSTFQQLQRKQKRKLTTHTKKQDNMAYTQGKRGSQ